MAKTATSTTRVSTKGQVILPKAVRVKRNWPAGTELVVEDTPEGVLLKAAPLFTPTLFEDVAGILRRAPTTGRALTIEEMDEAVQAEARRRACD